MNKMDNSNCNTTCHKKYNESFWGGCNYATSTGPVCGCQFIYNCNASTAGIPIAAGAVPTTHPVAGATSPIIIVSLLLMTYIWICIVVA
ncbi:unnamed protein product [Cuscuta campestris]|uniref:Uncharacterized protein n=1 Tax=Cuscuta campestris TaxID=132261 RepID=A0A484KIS0_9ASTE|nr:unnamed protein product [Cuscuta campestris]